MFFQATLASDGLERNQHRAGAVLDGLAERDEERRT
jgi:hypothetical protein